MKYFFVDRRGVSVEGENISLQSSPDSPGEVGDHINSMYPAGFSLHGAFYYRDPHENLPNHVYINGVLELLLEATRKAHYPSKPCRYQSMFAWDNLEDALWFKTAYGQPEHSIYEVQPKSEVHRGDMNLIAIRNTFACIDHRMHLYWQGKTLDIPGYRTQWEYVVSLPVCIGKRVIEG